MGKSKKITNILLVVIVILVIVGCVLAYFYFTKDKTKPSISPKTDFANINIPFTSNPLYYFYFF